ncbi:hypothetical protein [Celeribacter sp.]|uniref:hypothetical protein n=1 Tax=Celeribacter sp. TaxID=1890673 RepID=UPI003A909A02
MNKKLKSLRNLEGVADVALTVELKRLSEIRRKEDEIAAELSELSQALRIRGDALQKSETFDLAAQLGADARWQSWIRAERVAALQRVAGVAAQREEQMEKTRRAFGKLDALKSLQKKFR